MLCSGRAAHLRAPRHQGVDALTYGRHRLLQPRRLMQSARASAFEGVGAAIELRSRLQQMDLARTKSGGGGDGWEKLGGSWVRLPPGRAWGVVHFTGGAVLGAYPHIAYDALLSEIAESASLMVVATPFDLGTDHEALAASAAEKLLAALSAVALREDYPMTLPIFGLGHSLGAKLQVLLGSAPEGAGAKIRYAGHVLVAFNNASAADSVKLLEKFARELLQKRAEAAAGAGGPDSKLFDSILRGMPAIGAMAERAAAAAGLEFVPNPAETLARAGSKWSSPKTLFVTYENDDLDQNAQLAAALASGAQARAAAAAGRGAAAGGGKVETTRLPGNHLTPVVLSLEGSQLGPQLSRLGAIQVGDAAAAQALARQLAEWMRKP